MIQKSIEDFLLEACLQQTYWSKLTDNSVFPHLIYTFTPRTGITFTHFRLSLPNTFGSRLPLTFVVGSGVKSTSLLTTTSKALTFWTVSTAIFESL